MAKGRHHLQRGAAILAAVLAVGVTSTVGAAPNARIETVQAPAWLLRGGEKLPLEAGTQLKNRDRILTGAEARVVVEFADVSAFRIGERSEVLVNAMQQAGGRFSGGIDLKSGDLRLISHDYEESPVKRAINVRFGEVVAAVRSESDLTGTADSARDAVALRDGAAVFSHPMAAEKTELTTPLSVYEARHGEAPSVRTIDRFEGATWGLRTQPFYDGGSQQKQGRWWLRFGVFEKNEVLALHDRLRAAGFAPRIVPQAVAGGHRYELRLLNLVTEREAQSLAERLVASLQLPLAEVRQKP